MASFCMERLLFIKKFTLYFRRLNFFLWSIVIVLLLQQVHCQKPPVYTAESCSNESVFLFFSKQTAIQQSHIINSILTLFARSVRESIPLVLNIYIYIYIYTIAFWLTKCQRVLDTI